MRPSALPLPVPLLSTVLQAHLKQQYRLDCGHHVTFGYFLGNNVIILNGKKLKIICTECGY